jgi:hypothetical protein
MTPSGRMISKTETTRVLHRAGIPQARIDEILSQLPDPIDLDEAEALLACYGVTREHLIDQLGGSP